MPYWRRNISIWMGMIACEHERLLTKRGMHEQSSPEAYERALHAEQTLHDKKYLLYGTKTSMLRATGFMG